MNKYSQESIAPSHMELANLREKSPRSLRIGWFSSDLCYHPVGRFVYSYFANTSNSRIHNHILVDTFDHARESMRSDFDNLSSLEVLQLKDNPLREKLNFIKELSLDVAIDLGGWTANHFQSGFISRLAQINYLCYFASVGHSSMDAGSEMVLFPHPMREWHTENILRLPRCF